MQRNLTSVFICIVVHIQPTQQVWKTPDLDSMLQFKDQLPSENRQRLLWILLAEWPLAAAFMPMCMRKSRKLSGNWRHCVPEGKLANLPWIRKDIEAFEVGAKKGRQKLYLKSSVAALRLLWKICEKSSPGPHRWAAFQLQRWGTGFDQLDPSMAARLLQILSQDETDGTSTAKGHDWGSPQPCTDPATLRQSSQPWWPHSGSHPRSEDRKEPSSQPVFCIVRAAAGSNKKKLARS